MELTPKQIESIRLLYGEENSDDADYIIDLLRKKKNTDFLTKQFYYYSEPYYDLENKRKTRNIDKILEKKLFDNNGNINYTIEEFEQWLNHPLKKLEYKADSEYLESINQHFKQIKELVKKLKMFGSLEIVSNEMELLSKSIVRRSNRLVDTEVKRIDSTIEYLESRKHQLEQDSSFDVI